jgi:hypothetical protein
MSSQNPSAQTSVIQSTKQYQPSPMDQNDQNSDFNNDNQDYSMYGDEVREQNSLNKFKKSTNDYIENHYHDSSEDVEMDGNGNIIHFIIGK